MPSDQAQEEPASAPVRAATFHATPATGTSLQLMDVESALAAAQLQNPHLPFLTRDPTLIRLLMIQPLGVIVAEAQRVGAHDRPALVAQMKAFLTKAKDHNVDLAACPEYSCPWDALTQAVQADIFPSAGKLWALGCESATPAELTLALDALSTKVRVVFDDSVLQSGGNFVDLLVYLFRTRTKEGNDEVLTALLQAKTQAMGGTPFEQENLKTGRIFYRFRNSSAPSNSLFGLLCSDTLHPAFDQYVPDLRSDALVLHLQLNDNPSSPAFRKYREACCTYSPRTAEVLCLNWARGTQYFDTDKSVKPFITEPKTILFRQSGELIANDSRITENHSRGCYLTNWHPYRTAAFVFSPDPHVFFLELSKPSVAGPAVTTHRTGPRMLELSSWSVATGAWAPTSALDRFEDHWVTPHADLQPYLTPLLPHRLVAERLIQLCIGEVTDLGWASPWNLRSFVLAGDDTASRLTLCWSTDGEGPGFRDTCLSRFRFFAAILTQPARFSSRLSAFRSGGFEVAYKPSTLPKRLRNLHLPGRPSATAVYVGPAPSRPQLTKVKKQIKTALEQTEADAQLLAIWYHDPQMNLRDFMDEDDPEFAADPGDGAVDIQNASP